MLSGANATALLFRYNVPSWLRDKHDFFLKSYLGFSNSIGGVSAESDLYLIDNIGFFAAGFYLNSPLYTSLIVQAFYPDS